MSIAAVAHYMLPDTPYNLWQRDELAGHLHLRNDGSKAEVIGGEIVVSPAPTYPHNRMIRDIQRGIFAAEMANPSFPWTCITTMDLNLSDIHDGYVPDLMLLNKETDQRACQEQLRHLLPGHVELVVEVTSKSNAATDREPGPEQSSATKWNGYAQVGIPYYLLIDRDPRVARATLHSNPDRSSGGYFDSCGWEFGETIKLPEPFGFEIVTDEWEPWD